MLEILNPAALLGEALLIVMLFGASDAAAQRTGALLFSYQPHAGERASFDSGYQSHLRWHDENGDSLSWIGWDVIAGRRLGQFVDGTFGISFEAWDRRVDPAGDGSHALASFADHADATGRWIVRARPELSSALPLEDRSPPSLAQVVTYSISVAQKEQFEDILRRVIEAVPDRNLEPYTVYESVAGSRDVEFTMFVWRDGLASFDRLGDDPARAVQEAIADADDLDVRMESELWRLRSDLTLIPGRQ